MALKNTHVCLFKPVFINVKVTMITTIMKNISKTDTKLIWKKISHFTPILTYTPNKLKNRLQML